MKDRTCWTKMISSINFFYKKPDKSKLQNQTSKHQSKSVQQTVKQSTKAQQKDKTTIKPEIRCQTLKDSTEKEPICQTPRFNPILKTSLNKQNYVRQYQQEARETQRNFIQSEVISSNRGQSEQNSLSTQKSQIIMNDIGKDIDQNQNNFLFDQNYQQVANFSQLYQKIRFIKTSAVYDQWFVKKKATGQIRKAYVMKAYETFIEEWDMEEEESIEKYSDLYERQKHHIKNLVTLIKNSCRNLVKLLDYELKPPTININEGNKFVPGSVVVVFETIQSTLADYLSSQCKNLSHFEKKKLIYDICTCLGDIHQNNLTVKDLSLQSLGLDKFGNVKFNSLEVQDPDTKFYHSRDVNNERNIIYMAPEQFQTILKSDQTEEKKTFFHSGFSQISDFDKTQSTPEQHNLWTLGIIIGKILTGKFILNEQTAQKQKAQIRKTIQITQNTIGPKSGLLQKLQNLSINEMKIIECLLKINPSERLKCKQLLSLEYLSNILDDSCQQN